METKSTITSGIQFNDLEKSKDLAISELLSAVIEVNPKFKKFYQMYNLYVA